MKRWNKKTVRQMRINRDEKCTWNKKIVNQMEKSRDREEDRLDSEADGNK